MTQVINTQIVECTDFDQAMTARDQHYRMAKARGELVQRHRRTNVENKRIDYIVDVVKTRTVYRIGRKQED